MPAEFAPEDGGQTVIENVETAFPSRHEYFLAGDAGVGIVERDRTGDDLANRIGGEPGERSS